MKAGDWEWALHDKWDEMGKDYNTVSELWDQCKSCGINYGVDEDE